MSRMASWRVRARPRYGTGPYWHHGSAYRRSIRYGHSGKNHELRDEATPSRGSMWPSLPGRVIGAAMSVQDRVRSERQGQIKAVYARNIFCRANGGPLIGFKPPPSSILRCIGRDFGRSCYHSWARTESIRDKRVFASTVGKSKCVSLGPLYSRSDLQRFSLARLKRHSGQRR
jgi:hypothetical protein